MDILTGQLSTSLQAAAQLTAFALQAEYGDFDPVEHQAAYFDIYRYFNTASLERGDEVRFWLCSNKTSPAYCP